MANNLNTALDKAKQDIKDLTTNLTGLQKVAISTSKEISTVLGKGGDSQQNFLKLLTKINAQLKKLDKLNKQIIVSDGKVKVKKNELALTFQGLAKQRDAQAKKEIAYSKQTIKAIQDKVKSSQLAHQKEIDAIKKANKARLAEADLIHKNKKALDSQKKASEIAYQKQISDIKKANKARISEADLIYKNKQAIKSQKKTSEIASQKAVSDIKKANKARLSEADAIERNKKALHLQKTAATELSRAYVKLVNQQKQAKKVLQDLIVSQGKNSSQTKKAQREYDKLSKKINQANGASRNFAKKGLGSMARGFKNLLFAFGVYGGLNMFVTGLKNTAKRVLEFDKSMQNLAGVLRTTRKDLKSVEETIINVAGSSVKTSREVAALAESLATLGKTPDQIKKLLKPVVDLGIGLNVTSDKAGEFLVEMLNAFGASDDEAMKYADTIATIRTSTTLNFQKMRDSFQYIAPISKLLNKDLAYTGAVVGILADNGLKAQQAGRVLGTSLQKLAVQGKTLTFALNEINEAQASGVKETELLAMANKSFGAEGAKIGVILAQNTDLIEINAQAIRDNGGALNDLVNQQLESLDAKMKILDASWEKMIINIDNGTGAFSTFFKTAITGTTDFINILADLNTVSGIIGEGEEAGFLEKILPILGVNGFIGNMGRMRDATHEFQAITKVFNEIDPLNLNIDQVELQIEQWELMKTEVGDNVEVVKILDFYINKLKDSQTAYYEEGMREHEKKLLRDKKARLGLSEDEIMLVALKSKLKDLTYAQEQLGDASTQLKASQYDLWKKNKEQIEATKKAIEELTGVKEEDSEKELGYLKNSFAFFEKQISLAKEALKNTALTTEEYGAANQAIKDAEDSLDSFIRKVRGVSDKGEVKGIDLKTSTDEETTLSENRTFNDEGIDMSIFDDLEDIKMKIHGLNSGGIVIPVDSSKITEAINRLKKLDTFKDIIGGVTDTFSEMFDVDMSKFDMFFDGEKNSVKEWGELSKEVIGSVLDASMQRYDIELQEAQRVRDITLNNDLASDKAKENARKKFDAKERDIKTRKAKEERKNTLIKIAMDMAVGVATATASYLSNPLTAPALSFILPVIIGTGLAQAAIVASQPLPKFEKGGTMKKEGWAITQERRPEPIVDKFGNVKTMGSIGGDSMTYLNQGDRVFKSQNDFFKEFDVEKSVFDMNMNSNGEMLSEKIVDLSLLKEVGGLRGDIDKMGRRIEKMASRPINVNNTVEVKTETPY